MIDLKNLNRKESVTKFGTWFAKGATPADILTKCAERLALIEEWKKDLSTLKEEQEYLIKEQKIAELRASVASMSDKDKAELLALLSA
jgi:flagellar motility protein MotE (MotC chaperone)